jgi:uncharacterized membrane protein
MEVLILFLVLVLLVVPFVALVLVGTLWTRTRQLKEQMALADIGVVDLRQHVAHLEGQLQRMAAEIRGPRPAVREPESEVREAASEVGEPEAEVAVEPRPRNELLEKLQAAQVQQPPPPPPVEEEPAASEPPPADQPAPAIDGGWEQWLGVRGAAALGAGVLVLAGLYFFKYSIEHNLINETMRVVLGTLTGVACLVGAEAWLRRRHELLASCISGAGIAILYLTFWAAVARYGVISTTVAGALMVLVTAACCVLSIKRQSAVIALFGLLGGFATPLLLSTGSDRPVALFSYLLLLDVALLYVAHKRRWPMLALGSLLGTATYQGMWIIGRMGPERLGWGMLLCVVFAALFAFTTKQSVHSDSDDSRRGVWGMSRAAAVLLPFLFAFYFGLHADFGERFYPLAAYISVLVIGAGAVARRDNAPWLGLAGSFGALGVMAAWLLAHGLSQSPVVWWEVAGFSVVIALFTQGLAELERKREALRTETSMAAVGWALGSMLITAIAAASAGADVSPWPWLLVWSALGMVLIRHACMSSRPVTHMLAASGVGVSVLALTAGQLAERHGTDAVLLIGGVIGVAVLFQLVWLLPRASRQHAGQAAALLPLMLLFGLPSATGLSMLLYQAAALLLTLLIGFAVLRNRSAQWLIGAAPVLAVVQWWRWNDLVSPAVGELELAFVAHGLGVLLLGGIPLLLAREARDRRWTWRAAALAGPVMFLPMLALHDQLWGDDFIAALPLALGGFGLLQLLSLRRRGPSDEGVRTSGVAWLGAATLGFVTAAIPLQLENEWITIGWSLLALTLLLLWRHRDHAGLKYSALALFGAVTARLVTNPYVLDYHPRGSLRVFNWISYTYLIPVACLVGGAWLLSRYADARLRDWELSHRGRDLTSALLGMAAVTACRRAT